LPQGRFGKGVAALAGGTAAGQLIGILASPILTRVYSTEDFGTLGVFTSIIGILSIIACLRFELAMPLPQDDGDAASIGAVALVSSVMTALVVVIVLLFLGDDLARLTRAPGLEPFGWLLAVGVIAIGAYQVLNYWAVRRREYTRIARTKFIQGLSGVAVQLAGSLFAGPAGLLFGQVTVHAAGGTSLGRAFWREDRAVLKTVSLKRMRAVAGRYRHFPLIQAPASLINSAGLRIPQLLISGIFGVHIAGLFALGTRVIAAPVTFIGLSIAQVYVGEISRLVSEDAPAALNLFLTTARKLFIYTVVPISLLTALGPWMFAFVFGAEWREAGVMVQALGAMYLAQIVVFPLSQTLVVLERQKLQLVWDSGRLALTVAALALPRVLGAGPYVTIAIFGIAMAVAYVVHFFLMWWALGRNVRIREGFAA
jgi:O-antigen/teichoic acid export membrane protein